MNNNFIHTCKTWISYNNSDLLYRLIIIGGLLLVVNLLLWLIARLIQRHFAKLKLVWPQAIAYAIRLPGGVLIWIVGLSYYLLIDTSSPLERLAGELNNLAFIICFVWCMMRMISFVECIYSDETYAKSKQERETVYTIGRIAKVIFMILGLIVILQTFGISVSGLVAFGGVGAAGVAFSAKDVLGNFFGGIMVFFNRPFSVGDWIRSPDREIEGTVEHIGWLVTRIRDFDMVPIYVPNGIFSSIVIENPQRMLNRHIKQTIGLRYDDINKVSEITQAIKVMLNQRHDIDTRRTVNVTLTNLGASSVNIVFEVYTKTTENIKFLEVQQDILLKIMDIITQHGAQSAFPTTTLYVAEPMVITHHKED